MLVVRIDTITKQTPKLRELGRITISRGPDDALHVIAHDAAGSRDILTRMDAMDEGDWWAIVQKCIQKLDAIKAGKVIEENHHVRTSTQAGQ